MEDGPVKNSTAIEDGKLWQEDFAIFPFTPSSYQPLPSSDWAQDPPPPYSPIPQEQERPSIFHGHSNFTSAGARRTSYPSDNEENAPLVDTPQGIREVEVRKDYKGKVGLTVKNCHNGIFISVVQAKSPAFVAGLECGDQILEINGEHVSSYSVPRVHDIFKRTGFGTYRLIVRERRYFGITQPRHSITKGLLPSSHVSAVETCWSPVSLRRTMTFEKDKWGRIGFGFRNGIIRMVVGGSPAAQCGLLINHHVVEVNGIKVVGMKDREIGNIIRAGGNIITLTIAGAHEGF